MIQVKVDIFRNDVLRNKKNGQEIQVSLLAICYSIWTMTRMEEMYRTSNLHNSTQFHPIASNTHGSCNGVTNTQAIHVREQNAGKYGVNNVVRFDPIRTFALTNNEQINSRRL